MSNSTATKERLMPDQVIENPILNSAFREPSRHFKFTEEGLSSEIVTGRRESSYFIPIAQTRKTKGSKQLVLQAEWTEERIEPNKFVNRVRPRVSLWREGGYVGVTPTTSRLLAHWTDPERDNKLFFCQIEALETAIYITECAKKFGDMWIENDLREANESSNPGLPRNAFKMATGSGKTVVMAMIVAWHTLNKLASPQDARFSDAFLFVTPGITIRDRLRVLLPNDPDNYYRMRDIVPGHLREQLERAKIIITNFHAFQPRETVKAAKLTKTLAGVDENAFKETPAQTVRRVCRELGNKKNIIVLNDEAHHCYRRKPEPLEGEKLTGEDRDEAKKREEEARVWISGLEAVKAKLGVKVIYDLSATPFFLKGSGYREGTLFPWVVSDFSLIDSIESGIVKIPRVPVADNTVIGEEPTYRNFWEKVRDGLPKKGRGTETLDEEPKLPATLEGAIQSLYANYKTYHDRWETNTDARAQGLTPPVFIVVCNNTNVSKLVYNYISGWEKTLADDSTVIVPGKLDLFNNEQDGIWSHRPTTILVDSEQLESGEGLSPEFKKIAEREIEEFKADYRARFPGRDVDSITEEDLLREVMNTVGKSGKLGEHVKCVVSVSMLTEGWDANTVTHVLGIRAFGTQLLCEQVVGRALRRMSYAADERGFFPPEYAEVYGVPFKFMQTAGDADVKPPKPTTRVRALAARAHLAVTFPRLLGYRYEVPTARLAWTFDEDSALALTTADIPTRTENAPIVGASSIHTLKDLESRRPNEVAFLLAKLVLEKYFRADGSTRPEKNESHRFDGEVQSWLFPQVLAITKRWMEECLHCKDNTFPQLLLLMEFAHDAADRVYRSIVKGSDSENTARLVPILRPYDVIGSTQYVDFDTTRPVYATRADKCHISHVVADTESWEQKMAEALEGMDEVLRYVKNHNVGFTIPYTIDGEEKQYIPDFLVVIDDGRGPDDPLNLIIEVTGEKDKAKAAKVATARTLWIPAVNNHGAFGRWQFLEIADPWDAQDVIRSSLIEGTLASA
jgi:type III restriction enzyme